MKYLLSSPGSTGNTLCARASTTIEMFQFLAYWKVLLYRKSVNIRLVVLESGACWNFIFFSTKTSLQLGIVADFWCALEMIASKHHWKKDSPSPAEEAEPFEKRFCWRWYWQECGGGFRQLAAVGQSRQYVPSGGDETCYKGIQNNFDCASSILRWHILKTPGNTTNGIRGTFTMQGT